MFLSLLAPLLGSALGGLFAWLKGGQDLKGKQLDQDFELKKFSHELALRDKDIEVAKAEAQGRKDVAVIEGEAHSEAARFNAIADVEKADQVTADEIKAAGGFGWLLVIVDAMRKSVRPTLTYAMVGSALAINFKVLSYFLGDWEGLETHQQYEAGMQAFAWVTTQASGIITYWFMTRKSAP
jgi:hypothetical protein